ncbi:MAG: MBL fold metallo-hydrolase [Bacteroidetes bacterium]|nr:MBL fold metallo-hydrolase [Bacteroidota bacterium]
MRTGKYSVKVFESDYFKLDGGAMFGIIPKPLWEKTNPADEVNRIAMSTRVILLEWDNEKMLIDTGMGEKWDAKSRDIYAHDPETTLEKSLKAQGISPLEITKVLLTHLHFDHTGGSVVEKDGKLQPAFPNARYFVQKRNFEWGVNPSDRDRGSYIKNNFLPLIEEGVLELVEEKDPEFMDGITLHTLNGHTFGQQAVKISDGSSTLFFCADLIPTHGHIPLPYIMGYDLQPLVTLQEKKEVLAKAVEEDWTLILQHDPLIPAVKVEKTDRGFKIKEKLSQI